MSHKTQIPPSLPNHVRILKHRRKAGGNCGAVRDVFWREEKPWVVLSLLSGLRTVVPASWTDLPPKSLSATTTLQVTVPALVQVAHLSRAIQKRSARRRPKATHKAHKKK
jgi:hypothetical protein